MDSVDTFADWLRDKATLNDSIITTSLERLHAEEVLTVREASHLEAKEKQAREEEASRAALAIHEQMEAASDRERVIVNQSIIGIIDANYQGNCKGEHGGMQEVDAPQEHPSEPIDLPKLVRSVVAPALVAASKDAKVLRQLLSALETESQKAPPWKATVHERLTQRVHQLLLDAEMAAAKKELRGLLEHLYTLKKSLLVAETWAGEPSAVQAELTTKLTALMQWQQSVLSNPFVNLACSRGEAQRRK